MTPDESLAMFNVILTVPLPATSTFGVSTAGTSLPGRSVAVKIGSGAEVAAVGAVPLLPQPAATMARASAKQGIQCLMIDS